MASGLRQTRRRFAEMLLPESLKELQAIGEKGKPLSPGIENRTWGVKEVATPIGVDAVELSLDIGARHSRGGHNLPLRNIMIPSWPRRIDSGHAWVTPRNGRQTASPERRIGRPSWPATETAANAPQRSVMPGCADTNGHYTCSTRPENLRAPRRFCPRAL